MKIVKKYQKMLFQTQRTSTYFLEKKPFLMPGELKAEKPTGFCIHNYDSSGLAGQEQRTVQRAFLTDMKSEL